MSTAGLEPGEVAQLDQLRQMVSNKVDELVQRAAHYLGRGMQVEVVEALLGGELQELPDGYAAKACGAYAIARLAQIANESDADAGS